MGVAAFLRFFRRSCQGLSARGQVLKLRGGIWGSAVWLGWLDLRALHLAALIDYFSNFWSAFGAVRARWANAAFGKITADYGHIDENGSSVRKWPARKTEITDNQFQNCHLSVIPSRRVDWACATFDKKSRFPRITYQNQRNAEKKKTASPRGLLIIICLQCFHRRLPSACRLLRIQGTLLLQKRSQT